MFSAWGEFKKGKLKKQDIATFAVDIEDHLFTLHKELVESRYVHGEYTHFIICDPKRRNVHKAEPQDRLLHHAIFRILEPVFEPGFIFDSFSSRKDKGIHKAHDRFQRFAWRLSRNNTRTVWVLKCDIRKFFDSVDHDILLDILAPQLDIQTLTLLKGIIESFEKNANKGIPIGNLTSQLFSNIYLNEFDQFIKRKLRIKHYIRYADDFVLLSNNKEDLIKTLPAIRDFLKERLALDLHPDKIVLRKWNQGIDFLGYVIFPFHKVLRTKTKKRALRKILMRRQEFEQGVISQHSFFQSVQSYIGILKHCRGHRIQNAITELIQID